MGINGFVVCCYDVPFKIFFFKELQTKMKGGDVATCTTFHMGKGSVYQCKDRSGRQLIEKEKNLGFWVLVISNRRRKM